MGPTIAGTTTKPLLLRANSIVQSVVQLTLCVKRVKAGTEQDVFAMRGPMMAFLARGVFGRETPAFAGRIFARLLSIKVPAKKTTVTTV